jgi:hypothetical protein
MGNRYPIIRAFARSSPSLLIAAIVIGVTGAAASAADRPIAADRLQIKGASTGTTLTFQSRDAGFLFPALGGLDDPVAGGALVELIPATAPGMTWTVPAGAGKPGWTAKAATIPSLRFSNPDAPAGISPVRMVVAKEGKLIKLIAKDPSLLVPGSLDRVAIRITMGSLRNCALFGPGSIRKDAPGVFLAKKAPAPAIVDCSNASLGVPYCEGSAMCGGVCSGDGVCTSTRGGCRCISPSAPCGDTSPTCNGVCGAGEECGSAFDDPNAFCACVPVGTTACGFTGQPTCGGSCTSGEVCRPIFGGPSHECGCAPPGVCSQGHFDCPAGFACGFVSGHYGCAAVQCDGVYPTCGGPCGDGGECQPVRYLGVFTDCVCAVPGPCGAGCGGLTCGAGEVCAVDDATTCGCGAP